MGERATRTRKEVMPMNSKHSVIQGDSVEEMRKMDENSIDAIVCDPPY